MTTGTTKGQNRNGSFSYSGKTFDVYVTSLSYSWSLEQKGSSQARQRQTVYPFRPAASDISITLQFVDRYELLDFAKFARGYHLAVTSVAGEIGGSVPSMTFMVKVGEGDTRTFGVALPSIPVAQSNDSVGPKMNLRLQVLDDKSYSTNFSQSSSGTFTNKSVVQAVNEVRVLPSDVKTSGDNAYAS